MILDKEEFASIEPDIVSEMEKLCREEHYSMVAMLIMNPVEKNGEEIIVKGNKQIIEKAFGVTVKDDKCFIPTIMSRKKDFIPRIGRFLTG